MIQLLLTSFIFGSFALASTEARATCTSQEVVDQKRSEGRLHLGPCAEVPHQQSYELDADGRTYNVDETNSKFLEPVPDYIDLVTGQHFAEVCNVPFVRKLSHVEKVCGKGGPKRDIASTFKK